MRSALLCLTLAAGCASGKPGGPAPVDGGVDLAAPSADVDLAGTAADLAGSDGPACPSQVLCGLSAVCCAVGQECVDGACLAACATPSIARCASGCCQAGEVCLSGACRAPTTACKDSFDCAETEFCEPTLGKCLPQPPGAALCEYRPPVLPYMPSLEWSWTGSTIKADHDQVINMPVVIDLDGDTTPDVVIVTSKGFDGVNDDAYLRRLDGKTGQEKWAATADVYKDAYRVNPRSTPAAADLDGSGAVIIVAQAFDNGGAGGGLLAFRADGSFLWHSKKADGTDYNGYFNSATIAIADMDHDGKAEIVVGGVVLDATGKVVSGIGREFAGTNAANYGAVSILADVNHDGALDVVTGRAAYQRDGTPLWDCSISPYCGFASAATARDGYPAIADLNTDGTPELVVIANGTVRVQNATTGQLLASLALPGTGLGGPPTIADFDADGVMEISSANGTKYNVFEYSATPTPTLTAKWSSTTQDGSSNVTGSSVFDFEGDGAAEVVYGDECFFRVYSGKNGAVLFEDMSSSGTIHEYPVVVDVDGDNHTEVVVVSNDANHKTGFTTCPATWHGMPYVLRHGVFVYGDSNNKWVRTRKLWNEHAYHITNINSDGKLPKPEATSWVPPAGFNNYRVSTQGQGAYNAPDLRVDLEISTVTCPTALTLRARVKNEGSLGVPAGIKVGFYRGTSAAGSLIVEMATTRALLPGGSELLETPFTPPAGDNGPFDFFVVVDGAAAAQSTVDECHEDNNSAAASQVRCPLIN